MLTYHNAPAPAYPWGPLAEFSGLRVYVDCLTADHAYCSDTWEGSGYTPSYAAREGIELAVKWAKEAVRKGYDMPMGVTIEVWSTATGESCQCLDRVSHLAYWDGELDGTETAEELTKRLLGDCSCELDLGFEVNDNYDPDYIDDEEDEDE